MIGGVVTGSYDDGRADREDSVRLTQFTDNALRCLIYLAASDDTPHTIGEIAERMRASEDHLEKVVQRLVQLGYLRSTRGRRGGVQLARPATEINVGAVVRDTEENMILVECFAPETNDCPISPDCVLQRVLWESLGAFLGTLDRYTLEHLALPRPRLVKLTGPHAS